MSLKLAIVGAGPAGCMLARLLLHQLQPDHLSKTATSSSDVQPIEVTIFEGEPSIDFRSQGGTLDLHTNTGVLALQKAGLYEQFEAHARYDGEYMFWGDKDLRAYVKLTGETGRPEIDRADLRRILVESLPENLIQWRKKLVDMKRKEAEKGANQWELEFADGTTASGFDLVVGADGAWSKVRFLTLSEQMPYFSGVGGYNFIIPDAKRTAPDAYELVNRGSCFCFHGGDKPHSGRGLMSQQLANGDITVSAYSARWEDWEKHADYDVNDGAAVKKFVIEEQFSDWHPRLLDQVRKSDDNNVTSRPLYMLPVGFTWPHQKGVTILGDAAHLMTPFAGEGVNLAFEDAMHLCDAIKQTIEILKQGEEKSSVEEILDQNVVVFEKDMNQRATLTQTLTFEQTTDLYLTPGAPGSIVERFVLRNMKFPLRGGKRVIYYLFSPVTSALVYTGYCVYKKFFLK
ncbi:hypothetical protein BGW36DRAFT_393840 [Talaromyces proteolyticus]|uniref:FAD-binding domain-containing protein n=1 Tax=Talaromyces proteolyticus TaxID=1131652 RepID=A0AAD4PZZ3_9EURO|nr:uncharacterized protein BGW36DRAFT_393840 [Talaromyces proteolyticus]KAH8703533.1 hypothetical protein BGW36DRAFT_393840 [Talaromyces proteolyticus]